MNCCSYQLFVGVDISKGKADAAILKVSDLRSVKPQFLRKKLSLKFNKSDLLSFLDTVRDYSDENCTAITFGLEVTGIYGNNLYNFIKENLQHNESIHYLDTDFVNQWRQAHNIAKSDPIDAQTISTIIGTDDKVKYVSDFVFENEKGYQGFKCIAHRLEQRKKTLTQEYSRLIAHCDIYFPELQYVFDPKSAVFSAILSRYPTTHDIINTSKEEVFKVAYEASKHRVKMEKIDILFEHCADTIVPDMIPEQARQITFNLVESIRSIKADIKRIENDIKELLPSYELYPLLLTLTGCGPSTATVILAEVGDISRFRNADHFVSYCGCAPKNKRSGSSVESMGKISKKGSHYLRHAVYMIAEFARRHNPVLKALFERVKHGNKKRHKLAVVAVANKVARYIYSIMKYQTVFVIEHSHLMRLPEETRKSFFNSISTEFSKKTRKQIYHYSDENGEIFPFVFVGSEIEIQP